MKGHIKRLWISIMILVMTLSFAGGAYADSGTSSKDRDEITITLTGDLLCDTKYQRFLYNNNKKAFRFDQTFMYVNEIFRESDFTVGNLETCVASGYKLSRVLHFKDGKPYMNAPRIFLSSLKKAGFDGVVLANNHILDTGIKGLKRTIDALDDTGLKHTGAYDSSDSDHFFMFRKNDIRVAVLSYATYYNHREMKLTSSQKDKYLSTYSKSRVKEDIKAAKEAGADFIIAYIHAGKENTYKASSKQKKIVSFLAENGVDYVVGAHPHVLQPAGSLEIGVRTVHYVYSLGNFTGKLRRTKTRETAILKITIGKDEEGAYLKNSELIPIYMADKWKGKKMVLIPEGQYKGKNSYKTLNKHYKNIRKILKIK